MPKKSLTIDGKAFDSQTSAIEHFRSMLNRHTAGQIVGEEDAAELASLLLRHPDVTDKMGVGIDHFEVRTPPEFGGLCFWIIRTDESATDFSFMTCIRGKSKTVSQEFREACRMAVQNDIAKAKRAFFTANQVRGTSGSRGVTALTERADTGSAKLLTITLARAGGAYLSLGIRERGRHSKYLLSHRENCADQGLLQTRQR
jgi:Protein of unknown function (DUF3223)